MDNTVKMVLPAEHTRLLLLILRDYAGIVDERVANGAVDGAEECKGRIRWMRRYIEHRAQDAGVV